jgi:hypothetical protein
VKQPQEHPQPAAAATAPITVETLGVGLQRSAFSSDPNKNALPGFPAGRFELIETKRASFASYG